MAYTKDFLMDGGIKTSSFLDTYSKMFQKTGVITMLSVNHPQSETALSWRPSVPFTSSLFFFFFPRSGGLVLLLEKSPESFKIIQDTCCYIHPGIDNYLVAVGVFSLIFSFPLETRENDGRLARNQPFKAFVLNLARVEFQGAKGM